LGNLTLHDVAREANVSHTTVSFVLKGDPRISAATAERVLAVVKRLGYVPNEMARCLAKGCTSTIALVSPTFSTAYESELLRGIEETMASKHPDYVLVHYSTAGGQERAEALWKQMLRGNRADGFICLSDPPSQSLRQDFAKSRKALVLLDDHIEDTCCIRGDGRLGAQLATEHLLQQGSRRLAIVTSITSEQNQPRCNPERLETFRDICRKSGLEPGHLTVNHYHPDAGKELVSSILRHAWDGIFCAAGDMVSAGIIAGCRLHGVAIPDKLRLIGYDDLPLASLIAPSLTTISQPLFEMGKAAVERCFSLIETRETESPKHIKFDARLIQREST
jgi:DNA-binding LacI/PurR family transcriptional regulator